MDWIPPSKFGEGVAWPEDRAHWDAEPENDHREHLPELNVSAEFNRHINTQGMPSTPF